MPKNFARRFAVSGLCVAALSAAARADGADALRWVDPQVGTSNGSGATYPGAALPYAMVKLSPDTTKPSSAGYNPAEPIVGFSHTHIAGTGGSTFEGQIRVRPQAGGLVLPPPPSPKANEKASAGYYAVDLTADGVRCELTSTERAGFHRYTFAPGKPARVLIDVAAVINNNGPDRPPAGVCTGSSAKFVSDTEVEGQTSIKAGLGGLVYTVHFVARFDKTPTAHGTWQDAKASPGTDGFISTADRQAGVYAEFAPGSTVNLRVGISYTDVKLARKNLNAADGQSFDDVRKAAAAKWAEYLGKITVEGGTDAQRKQFYTALYHSLLTPTDLTGDNGRWAADDQPVYSDLHTLWDTSRSTDPLRVLIDPDRERGVIRCLLAVYEKIGWLPDAWAHNKHSIAFQGGTHADNVIADAVVKKLGGFDLNLAYAAVKKNATESDPKVGKTYPGRGRMTPYLTLGYVPSNGYSGKEGPGKTNEWGSGVSRTLEYAYNDFCVAQVAAAAGHAADAEKFRQRSLGVYTLFDPVQKLFWGKTADDKFCAPEDPTKLTWGWMNMFYEGSAWQYRFSVPHDMAGLIERMDGDEKFVATLDEYFDRKLHYAGNEPGFLNPWAYVYAGRPDRTADRVRFILANDFHPKPAGYPGDEDVGAMSAYYVFSAIGLMPNAGQDVYLLGSPLFSKTTLRLGQTGKTLSITAAGVSDKNRYVQSATLNGKPFDRAWLRHGEIVDGADLVLTMCPTPSKWGTTERPPSLSR